MGKDGWTDFDVCIAAPDMMGLVGPLGRVLGPRGLMPSARAGTVTPDVAKVVGEYKAGKVEFRNKQNIRHYGHRESCRSPWKHHCLLHSDLGYSEDGVDLRSTTLVYPSKNRSHHRSRRFQWICS